jgi:hypothetical protein
LPRRNAIFCKSFKDDFPVLKNLISSVAQHAPGLAMLISVPRSDLPLLKDTVHLPGFVSVVADEDYLGAEKSLPSGWYHQQVCKMSMHRLGFADSYFVLDSDAYLIAPVEDGLFQIGENLVIVASDVYTRLNRGNMRLEAYIERPEMAAEVAGPLFDLADVSENLLTARRDFANRPWQGVKLKKQYLSQVFPPTNLSMQPAQIFHTEVLRSIEGFLDGQGMDWWSLIELAPWEYSWYGRFALSLPDAGIIGRPSPVVHFASEDDVAHAKAKGYTLETLRQRFCAVQMAARHFDRERF